MKLVRLKVEGFGSLKGEFRFDPDRVTLVVDDNERGKSTLIAAINAALYGLEDDRRSFRTITPLERWRPWGGGAYQVELELEHGHERIVIHRDFERGTVSVFNGSGKEITEKYRAGKDEFPVGKTLFGLDESEFEKCALLRQGELDLVVPAEERARRHSTLHARLENAADTKVGDTNATEAVQVLQSATSAYTSPELGTTMKVESAIQKLEAKLGLIEADLKASEHDLATIADPMEELSKLADEESAVKGSLDQLDAERRVGLAQELRRKLKDDDGHRDEWETLRREARKLEEMRVLPPNAEADLRDAVARHEEMLRKLDALEQRRVEEQTRERSRVEEELETLKAYAACTSDDADRFIALASELRRIADEDERLRTETFNLRDSIASRGHEPERMGALRERFGELSGEQEKLLRGQSELALQFQTEVATLENARTEATETLRSIDALRNARRLPGWVLTALGLGLAAAGFALLALKTAAPLWTSMLAIGGVSILIGLPLLLSGANAKQDEREDALRKLADAQRRLNQLRQQRAESEVNVNELSRSMGYRDPVELLRDWNEYTRVMDESGPIYKAESQLQALRDQRSAALAEVKSLLTKIGGGSPDPGFLERAAHSVRLHLAGQKQLNEISKGWGWIEEEKRVTEAQANGLRERAIKVLEHAGIDHEDGKPWADYLREIGERARTGQRLEVLRSELIPQAERRMLPETQVEEIRAQLTGLEAVGPIPDDAKARPQADLEAQTMLLRAQLDSVKNRRQDLRVQVEDVWRKVNVGRAEKSSELDRIQRALDHARRFQRAVAVATETIQSVSVETHRRWADHLNERVRELLKPLGTGVEQVRFGEDLDFSIKPVNGQQAPRGKATAQLSAGARDQLYLAIRLAVSEYLARGQAPAPLLLDDAFATSDDSRAAAGMHLLLEHFSKQHQVIVATCHRKRHESMAANDAKLWEERVQWLDLGAAVRQG